MADFFAEINREIRNQKSAGANVAQSIDRRRQDKIAEESANQKILGQRLDNILKIANIAPETAVKAFNSDAELRDAFGGNIQFLGKGPKKTLMKMPDGTVMEFTQGRGGTQGKVIFDNLEGKQKKVSEKERKDELGHLKILQSQSNTANDDILSGENAIFRIRTGGKESLILSILSQGNRPKARALAKKIASKKIDIKDAVSSIQRIVDDAKSIVDANKPFINTLTGRIAERVRSRVKNKPTTPQPNQDTIVIPELNEEPKSTDVNAQLSQQLNGF